MPRPHNAPRAAARSAGERFYLADNPCIVCGERQFYTSNAQCVACAKAAGSLRYANMSATERAALKQKDHERYVNRLTASTNEYEQSA